MRLALVCAAALAALALGVPWRAVLAAVGVAALCAGYEAIGRRDGE